MAGSLQRQLPPVGWGLASIVLGAIGLLLFVVPILAIPISLCGALLGLMGAVSNAARARVDLRLSLAGIALCCLALLIDLGVNYAPGGFLGRPAESQIVDPAARQRYVPPPAAFR
jgi:hypothetical protein